MPDMFAELRTALAAHGVPSHLAAVLASHMPGYLNVSFEDVVSGVEYLCTEQGLDKVVLGSSSIMYGLVPVVAVLMVYTWMVAASADAAAHNLIVLAGAGFMIFTFAYSMRCLVYGTWALGTQAVELAVVVAVAGVLGTCVTHGALRAMYLATPERVPFHQGVVAGGAMLSGLAVGAYTLSLGREALPSLFASILSGVLVWAVAYTLSTRSYPAVATAGATGT